MTRPRVFLDASCWVAATLSPGGGSAFILEFALKGTVRIVATGKVLREAHANIKEKFGNEALLRYLELLSGVEPDVVGPASEDELFRWDHVTDMKDRHVLAGAAKAGADALVTLDRKHMLTDRVKDGFDIPVMDPKEFLENILRREET